MRFTLFFALLWIGLLSFYSQSIYFPYYHYESENGLIHLNVLSIQEDKNKVLYFVTNGGVYQYSGDVFSKITRYSALKNIRNIFFNDTTCFLVHRDKGLFYLKNNNIEPFFKDNPFKRPSDKMILNNQFVYNFTEQISFEIYDLKNKMYYNDSLLMKDNSNQAYSILLHKNNILVGRQKGLYVVNGNKITHIRHLSKIPVYSIFYNANTKQLYIGSNNKIIILDDSLFKIQKIIPIDIPFSSQSNQMILKLDRNISKISVDKFNRIWFTIQPDDNVYLLDNNKVYNILNVLNISPTLINDIYIDGFNNVWIATFNDGVYHLISTYWQSFQIIEYEKKLNVRSIEQNNHTLFIATNNGLYYTDTSQFYSLTSIIPPDNFFNHEISFMQKVQDKIYCANITAFDTRKYTVHHTSIYSLPFKQIAFNKSSHFYATDITNNILFYDASKNKVIDTIFQPSDFRMTIKHLFYFDNQLYIATNKGLLIYNEKNKQIQNFLTDKEVQKTMQLNNHILILYENKIFDYTNNRILLDAEKYNVVTLTDVEKWNDYYFIASEEGLLLLDKNFSFLNSFNRQSGLISNIINDALVINNTIYLATDKGISFTKINNLLHYKLTLNTPNVTFISTNTDSFPYIKNTSLAFKKNIQDIYFHIICPNFNPLTKTIFQYSLNNSEWINFENSPLHFSSLAGGNYTLKIRATTDKIHFTEPLVIQFTKQLSFQETPWFWPLIILSMFIVSLTTFYIIKKIEHKKNAEKLKNVQQMNLLKHQAMNAILSPHFIFNSLTGIQNYILKNDTEKASDYLSKFSRLIRMIIEKASHPTISIYEEIKRLQFYLELEKERFHDKFDFEIVVDEKIDQENTFIPNMIIQPYLENAILHGILPKKEKGFLTLSFQLIHSEKKHLEIKIEDNGIGFLKGEERKPKHHKSLATQTISEILAINTQLYGKQQSVEIIDQSTLFPNKSGTVVKIILEL